MSLNAEVRALFPQLNRRVRDRRLVYLDSGATTLKPRAVIEAVEHHMSHGVANVHRGAHLLSDEATEAFEKVREQVARFVGAHFSHEIVFTRGTTEGLNLLARSIAFSRLQAGDEVILSQMEHHSNIVPWHMIAQEKGIAIRFVPVLEDGTLDFEAFKKMLSPAVKVVSLVHLSNALGTLNSLREFFHEAHKVGALCIADAAQSASLIDLNVQELGCDFMVFSGHKMFAPTGIGVLFGRSEILETLPPYQGGGSMISDVREESVEFLPPPHRFEAGTPPIAEVMGLGAAVEFIQQLGHDWIQEHERRIMQLADEGLRNISGGMIRQIGTAPGRAHVLSFLIGSHHPSDVGAILDEQGVAVRAGHHCCQPLMRRFGIPGTVRASFSVYTSEQDIEDFLIAVRKAKEMLS